MTTLREAAEQALEALDGTEALLSSMDVTHLLIYKDIDHAINALRAALAEPEPHNQFVEDFWDWLPKAYRDENVGDEPKFTKYNMEVAFAAGAEAEGKRIALAEPERKPLTVEEIKRLIHPIVMADVSDEMTDYEIVRAIEAAHGITGESK